MKKYLYLIILLALFAGCSKEDDEPTEQTFFVNVYYTYSDYPDYGDKLAAPSMVMIYEDNGKAIDTERVSLTDPKLYDTDGVELQLEEVSSSTSGVNIFENIPNGKYVILAIYQPATLLRYYSYKKITVNYDYRATTETVVFDCSKDYGYQTWKEKK